MFHPPLDAPALRSIRDLQVGLAKRGRAMAHGAGAGEAGDGAVEGAGAALLAGAISLHDVHVTLMSAAEIKASGVSRAAFATALERHPELCAQAPSAQTDAIPRLGISGGNKTAFLAMRDQEAWRRFGEAVMRAAAQCERVTPQPWERTRDFHVSWWNSARTNAGSRACLAPPGPAAADVHDSIGGLTRAMDPRGKTFKAFFQVTVTLQEALLQGSEWAGPGEETAHAGEEASAEGDAEAGAGAEAAAEEAALIAAGNHCELSAVDNAPYAPRDMTLTQEELRRGITCRRPAADVECCFKFPRTYHIHDTGNMEKDDLLVPRADAAAWFLGRAITVEEKIDGANIGISLHPEADASGYNDNRPAFRFQKRSHYVTEASEEQFRGLESWAEQHKAALRRLLLIPFSGGSKARAGQRIVFGDWLAGVCVCVCVFVFMCVCVYVYVCVCVCVCVCVDAGAPIAM